MQIAKLFKTLSLLLVFNIEVNSATVIERRPIPDTNPAGRITLSTGKEIEYDEVVVDPDYEFLRVAMRRQDVPNQKAPDENGHRFNRQPEEMARDLEIDSATELKRIAIECGYRELLDIQKLDLNFVWWAGIGDPTVVDIEATEDINEFHGPLRKMDINDLDKKISGDKAIAQSAHGLDVLRTARIIFYFVAQPVDVNDDGGVVHT